MAKYSRFKVEFQYYEEDFQELEAELSFEKPMPTKDDMIEQILFKNPWLQAFRASINVINFIRL